MCNMSINITLSLYIVHILNSAVSLRFGRTCRRNLGSSLAAKTLNQAPKPNQSLEALLLAVTEITWFGATVRLLPIRAPFRHRRG